MPSLVGSGRVVLEEEIFFNFVDVFSLFRYYHPLEKDLTLNLNKTNLIPFTQGYFVSNLIEIGQVVLEKEIKMWKVYDDNNNGNEDGQRIKILISKARLRLRLRWVKTVFGKNVTSKTKYQISIVNGRCEGWNRTAVASCRTASVNKHWGRVIHVNKRHFQRAGFLMSSILKCTLYCRLCLTSFETAKTYYANVMKYPVDK